MPAENILFPRPCYEGMISTSLEVIWEISGYYVLPLLLGDQLVGRLDLKADRQARILRVQAAHVEPDADTGTVAAAAAAELDSLRSWLRLDHVVVAGRGGLARELRRSVRAFAGHV